MVRFELKEIEEVNGKIKFFKLIVDGNCEFDDFCKEIEKDGNLKRQLIQVQARMEDVADMKRLPKNKFRDITPKKESIKEYEIKTKNLRIYLFHEEFTGKIIVLAGKKSTQKKDIRRFRKIKKRYFEQK
jgi:putative component of toxin-antitoxin plasmid stabilization module